MDQQSGREFLRFVDQKDYDSIVPESDQQKKKPKPSLQKDYPVDSQLIDLIHSKKFSISSGNFFDVIQNRKSRRKYTDEKLSLEELSYLLWCTQGVRKIIPFGVMRTVPSAGARSPFETYLFINRIESLKPGLYRYISFEHKLLYIKDLENYEQLLKEMTYNQGFIGLSAVTFCWVAIPYRTEWRYSTVSHKFIAIDLGMLCENLYLASESLKLGTVAIGYYDQHCLDNLLDLDGEDKFVVLVAPVGKVPQEKKISEFFQFPKAEVSPKSLSNYIGTCKREGLPSLQFKIENNQLLLTGESVSEILTPYNNSEFTGELMFKAIRFIHGEDGGVEKVKILFGAIFENEVYDFEFFKV